MSCASLRTYPLAGGGPLGKLNARGARLQVGFAESHAAEIKHSVITIENNDREDKEVPPAHKLNGGKASSEGPRGAAHER